MHGLQEGHRDLNRPGILHQNESTTRKRVVFFCCCQTSEGLAHPGECCAWTARGSP
nr:MAG TPA: hypothetical protein [Bacteriophage sp.]